MPIFEYRCAQCDTRFERILFRRADKVECPSCRSSETDRLPSTFAVSAGGGKSLRPEPGPCHCGAPRRGMCGEN